ncbi:MAG: RNA polymerase subunit sigma-24 [Betaproteobacteria bacterium RIFCSPLOWO2_12_FULL_65_14]|nr:MAG: RNA polymerase subunit sigma-24 [Betaproteobacteria bacterium RIFCSPLOWO2_12_FULL_65_14]
MNHTEPTDRRLALLCQRGDQKAFSELARRYQDRLYRFILRMVGSHDEALELAQDTFIKAWQALPDWRPDAEFRTWLFRIGSNAAMDALRRRKVVEFVAMEDDYDAPGGSEDPEAQLQTKQRLRALEAALGRLPHDQREVVLLREIEDMSYSEIGAVLGINEGTVKSRLARAREALINDRRRTNA